MLMGSESGNHNRSIPSECTICSQTFDSRTQLFSHLRSAHDLSKGGGPSSADRRNDASNLARSSLTNPGLEAYYAIQSSRCDEDGIMAPQQWESALATYRTPLPLSFRVNANSVQPGSVQELLLDELFASVPPDAVQPVPEVPNLYTAQTPTRFWSDQAKKLLADAQEIGACHRQEIVSAIPPLLLDVEPHHTVIDLCAAPGSKTLQILDLMHKKNTAAIGSSTSTPEGVLVANDPNRNRLLQLTRRSRRQSRTPLVTSASDGRYFPTLRKRRGYKLKFDRVLCDVPCSGDGTLRKMSAKEWRNWSVKESMSLHKLQVRLLVRALKAVKRGGRVLYSTCSLNPIEDEAVIVDAIRQCTNETDSYRILPLPEVIGSGSKKWERCCGAIDWLVPDKKFTADNPIVYESYQSIPTERKGKGGVSASMFPPKKRRANSSDEESNGNCLTDDLADELERTLPNCARILPQHLNSGGFFAALIERQVAAYYPVCLDLGADSCVSQCAFDSIHHGNIYFPVQTARQVRDVIRSNSNDVAVDGKCRHIYEGFSSLGAAQQWLRMKNSFVDGKSDVCCSLPNVKVNAINSHEVQEHSHDCANIETDKKHFATTDTSNSAALKPPSFPPLFREPHPQLVKEFCEFYGLGDESGPIGVDRFPVEDVRIIGGGADAELVTSYLEVPVSAKEDLHGGCSMKRKYLQLTLISETMCSITSGGAKFTPIEAGLGLCFVPVMPTAQGNTVSFVGENTNRRSGGRFTLLDEAVELVAKYATKRVVILSRQQGLHLLTTSLLSIDQECSENEEEDPIFSGKDAKDHCAAKEGKYTMRDVSSWDDGGIIGIVTIKSRRQMFLSCHLCTDSSNGGKGVKLLSDDRLAEVMQRALEQFV